MCWVYPKTCNSGWWWLVKALFKNDDHCLLTVTGYRTDPSYKLLCARLKKAIGLQQTSDWRRDGLPLKRSLKTTSACSQLLLVTRPEEHMVKKNNIPTGSSTIFSICDSQRNVFHPWPLDQTPKRWVAVPMTAQRCKSARNTNTVEHHIDPNSIYGLAATWQVYVWCLPSESISWNHSQYCKGIPGSAGKMPTSGRNTKSRANNARFLLSAAKKRPDSNLPKSEFLWLFSFPVQVTGFDPSWFKKT